MPLEISRSLSCPTEVYDPKFLYVLGWISPSVANPSCCPSNVHGMEETGVSVRARSSPVVGFADSHHAS